MNDNAKAWIAALRSGEYTQTIGRLTVLQADSLNEKIKVGDCCLGVACKLAVKAGIDLKVSIIGRVGGGVATEQTYDGEVSVLPEKVRAWLGLTTATGALLKSALTPELAARVENNGTCSHDGKESLTALTTLNDTLRLSFAEIADVVEAEPIGLFAPPTPLSGPI